jgi:hypothetical protein
MADSRGCRGEGGPKYQVEETETEKKCSRETKGDKNYKYIGRPPKERAQRHSPHVLRRGHDDEADRPLVTENLVRPSPDASYRLDGRDAVVRDQDLLDDATGVAWTRELGDVRGHVLEATVEVWVRRRLGQPPGRCPGFRSLGRGGGERHCLYCCFVLPRDMLLMIIYARDLISHPPTTTYGRREFAFFAGGGASGSGSFFLVRRRVSNHKTTTTHRADVEGNRLDDVVMTSPKDSRWSVRIATTRIAKFREFVPSNLARAPPHHPNSKNKNTKLVYVSQRQPLRLRRGRRLPHHNTNLIAAAGSSMKQHQRTICNRHGGEEATSSSRRVAHHRRR